MRMPRAAVLVDPGWMFLVAGLVLVASAALVPATYDLWVMRAQLKHLEAQERENAGRLAAYERFIGDLAAADPQLVRRLAASQLNLVPRGERPMIVASSAQRPPLDWVEASVQPVQATVVPFPDSLLSRLTLGRKALWIAGAGAMCIFLGLLSAPLRMRLPTRPSLEEAGARAARALGVPAPAVLAGAGPSLPVAHADSQSSAVPSVRIGGDALPEHDPAPHGAD
ncbi:MAG: hypothetical protein ACKOEL_04995 [Planctomycetota bacterium]|jgi:hypothetical protein